MSKTISFKKWLLGQTEREDGIGDLSRWVDTKAKDIPKTSDYGRWLKWYYETRASKASSTKKERLGDFDQAWYEYMYDLKMIIWKTKE